MQSEYDRNYRWQSRDDMDIERAKQMLKKQKPNEPLMKHKRRVKLAEDNVLIGEPLTSQKLVENVTGYEDNDYFIIGNKKERFGKSDLYKSSVQYPKRKPRRSESLERPEKSRKNRFTYKDDLKNTIDESVQTIEKKEIAIQTDNRKKRNETNNWKLNLEPLKPSTKTKPREHHQNQENTTIKHPKPPKLTRHGTEYQTNYDNKFIKSIDNPALLDKRQENSSKLDTKLRIYSNFISEYQRQFKPYEYVTDLRYRRMRPATEDLSNRDLSKETQLKFVPNEKKIRSLTPPPRIDLGDQNDSDDHIYEVEDTRNIQSGRFPYGKSSKHFMSEYQANYDNKWSKLDEELARSMEEELQRKANAHSKWFQEILELRKKAHEYRMRSRGSHFSKEHLGQVYIKGDGSRNRSRSSSKDRSRFDEGESQRSSQRRSKARISTASQNGSSVSTIVGRPISKCGSRSPERSRVQAWNHRTAGKPSFDNSLLVDESASHDTDFKDQEVLEPTDNEYVDQVSDFERSSYISSHRNNKMKHQSKSAKTQTEQSQQHPEKKYTFQKYFNEDPNIERLSALKYEDVNDDISSKNKSLSTRSIVSSSTMSLAKETLERARRNRDEILRQKIR